MTAVDVDALDAARAAATYPGEWGRGDEKQPNSIFVPGIGFIGYAHRKTDAALIVAAVNALPRLTAAIRGVLAVHGAIDAVQYLGARQIPRHVCTGCGSDDGNWQLWPCPTVRAITAALATDEGTDR